MLIDLAAPCRPDQPVSVGELPSFWEGHGYSLCGFFYSYDHPDPLTNLSACCDGLLGVSQSCFQVCRFLISRILVVADNVEVLQVTARRRFRDLRSTTCDCQQYTIDHT